MNNLQVIFRVLGLKYISKEAYSQPDFEWELNQYTREWRFHPKRKWRYDWAFPKKMVAIEQEGIVYRKGQHPGRHLSPKGYTADIVKYNTGQMLGWTIFRLSYPMYFNGEAYRLIEDLKNKEWI